MYYLSKKTIIAAYNLLSTIDSNKVQGLTQKVSALKYFAALDLFYKSNSKDCDVKKTSEKEEFVKYVGQIVKINDQYCTKNFSDSIGLNGRDYDCGSNFFSVSSVKDSKTNPSIIIKYPKRSGWKPGMDVMNQVLIRNEKYYNDFFDFFLPSKELKLAFTVWLLRFDEITTDDFNGLKTKIASTFTEEFCYALIPQTVSDSDIEFIKFSDTVTTLNPTDFPNASATQCITLFNSDFPLQQIFYGAPGTGKSNTVKQVTDGQPKENVFRTTFHPDSDYSTFVGCYKPTKEEKGEKSRSLLDKDELVAKLKEYRTLYDETMAQTQFGYDYYEELSRSTDLADIIKEAGVKTFDTAVRIGMSLAERTTPKTKQSFITYSFVPQAFTKAYCEAWNNNNPEGESEPVFLVIEEINRGNCAQIFGDIFQLLDRKDNGFSDYPIDADEDLKAFLENGAKKDGSQWLTNKDGIANGKLCLPPNLYIWATMNTSDQSLFPIDSAFKRRWDWKYIPIADAGKGYQIEVGGKAYDWWDFLEKINAEIGEVTSSEDKMLGYFFAKAKDGKVTADMFVSKVLFYLWNDVFKDFGTDRPIFEKGKNDKGNTTYLSFKDFFKPNGDVNEENVIRLLDNLKVKASQEAEEDDDGNTPSTDASKRNYDKFSVNGEGAYGKNRLAEACVKKYIELHSEKSADEVVTEWKTLGEIVSHFIETEEEFDARTDNAKDRSTRVECNGSALYVAHKGYGEDNGKAEVLMNAVNSKDWGITIEKL